MLTARIQGISFVRVNLKKILDLGEFVEICKISNSIESARHKPKYIMLRSADNMLIRHCIIDRN